MIDLLDEALREYLIRELPVRENEIDISFEQPKREWSARLSRPTLNLFLRELRENTKLRSPQPGTSNSANGQRAVLQRHPVRVDLAFMATAWAKDPLDEHRILARLLAAIFRTRALPDDLVAEHVPGQEAGVPIRLSTAETPTPTASDLWSVLDNEMRPAVDFVATLAIHPFDEFTLPLVRELEFRYNMIKSSPADGRRLLIPAGTQRVGDVRPSGGPEPPAAPESGPPSPATSRRKKGK